MNTDIENRFLDAYREQGFFDDCICFFNLKCSGRLENDELLNELSKTIIREKFCVFDSVFCNSFVYNGAINTVNSPIIDEIDENLRECQTQQDKDRYIYSILTPFKQLCSVFQIKNELTKDANVRLTLNRIIETPFNKLENKSIEKYLRTCYEYAITFGHRLGALLLEYGIDIMRLQKECGIYLIERDINVLAKYIGTEELVKKYIDALPKQEQPQQSPTIPAELDTDEAKRLLVKVIGIGFCDKEYNWKKTKSLLAYFAEKTSDSLRMGKGEYDGKQKISWKPFETLFKIKGLSGAKQDSTKTGTSPIGHKDIDALFN